MPTIESIEKALSKYIHNDPQCRRLPSFMELSNEDKRLLRMMAAVCKTPHDVIGKRVLPADWRESALPIMDKLRALAEQQGSRVGSFWGRYDQQSKAEK
jgi:hypothetical protein